VEELHLGSSGSGHCAGSSWNCGGVVLCRGVQNNRLTEKTDKTEEKLTGKTKPKKKTD